MLDKLRNMIWPVVFLAIIAALFFWAFQPQPVPVDIAEISTGTLEVTIDEEGVTRIREIYAVSAPVPGRMLRSPLEVGDVVEGGKTIVAIIEPEAPPFLDARARQAAEAGVSGAQAGLSLARAERGRVQAELDYWRAEHDRAAVLARRNTISAQALDRARMEMEIRRANLATAEANIGVREQEFNRAQAALIGPEELPSEQPSNCCVNVAAPTSGSVLRILTESQQVIAPGQPLVEIGDPHDLEIVTDLLSRDAVKVAPDMIAAIERWGGDVPLKARVTRVDPAGFMKVSALGIDEQRVNVVLEIESPPRDWSGLGHDYRVFVRIRAWAADDIPLVPLGARFRTGDEWTVYRAVDGTAMLTPVTIGRHNSRTAQILEGLEIGDGVILHPSDRIGDGARIVDRAGL